MASPIADVLKTVPPPLPSPLPPAPEAVQQPNLTTTEAAHPANRASLSEQTGVQQFLPLGNYYKWVRVSFLVFCASEALMAASALSMIIFFTIVRRGNISAGADLQNIGGQIDSFQQASAIIFLLAFAVSIIMYLRFIYRSMANLHALKVPGVTISPSWAVGWYFVPIAFLWKPFQAMQQIWSGSHDPNSGKSSLPAAMGLWWTFWLVDNFLGQISFRLSTQAGAFGDEIKNYDLLEFTFWLDLAGALCGVVSALLLLSIVKRISAAQSKWVENK